jgi:hypothetical protein
MCADVTIGAGNIDFGSRPKSTFPLLHMDKTTFRYQAYRRFVNSQTDQMNQPRRYPARA